MTARCRRIGGLVSGGIILATASAGRLTAQTDEIVARLTTVQNAVSGLRLAYTTHREPRVPVDELRRRWRIAAATLDATDCEFRKDGGRWVCRESYFSETADGDRVESSRWWSSCDGEAVFLAGEPNIVYTRQHLAVDGNRPAYSIDYFVDVRLKPASRPASFDGPATSLVLDDMRRADSTSISSTPGAYVVTVRLGARTRVYHLDRKRGLAVCAWEEFDGDRMFRSVAMNDFVEVAGVFWPRSVEATWYGWVTKDAELLDRPGMMARHYVTEIGPYRGDDTFQLAFAPGTAVYDMRYGDSETAYHGFLGHTVPFSPDEMVGRFRAGSRTAPSHRAQLPHWFLPAIALVALGVVLSRGARR